MVEYVEEIAIRLATPADAAAIAGVHVTSWQEAYEGIVPAEHLAGLDAATRAERWKRDLESGPADGVRTWVAEADGAVVGFLTVGPSRDEDAAMGEREIYSMYLDPDMWGHGVARPLLRDVLEDLGDGARVSLWVLSAGERARHFYRRHGFSPDGTERFDEVGGTPLLELRYRRS